MHASLMVGRAASAQRRARLAWAAAAGLAALACAPAAAQSPASARVLTVCAAGCDYPTIQAGVAAARSGDRLLIRRGYYREDVSIIGKSLELVGDDSSGTVILGSGNGPVLRLRCADPRLTIQISGITITGGNAQPPGSGDGGGIANFGCTLHVDAAVFDGNVALGFGGAIYSERPVVVSRSSFVRNRASGGGAIFARARTTIVASGFVANEAGCRIGVAGGGALFGPDLQISDSEFVANATNPLCRGIVHSVSGLSVKRSRFVENTGGPVFFAEGASVLRRVLLSRNTWDSAPPARDALSAQATLGPGTGAVFNNAGATMTLQESLVIGNSGPTAGGIVNNGTLTLIGTTVTRNSGRDSGGIANTGALRLVDSAVSGNEANGSAAGGLWNEGGSVTLRDSAVTDNTPGNCVGVDFACP